MRRNVSLLKHINWFFSAFIKLCSSFSLILWMIFLLMIRERNCHPFIIFRKSGIFLKFLVFWVISFSLVTVIPLDYEVSCCCKVLIFPIKITLNCCIKIKNIYFMKFVFLKVTGSKKLVSCKALCAISTNDVCIISFKGCCDLATETKTLAGTMCIWTLAFNITTLFN